MRRNNFLLIILLAGVVLLSPELSPARAETTAVLGFSTAQGALVDSQRQAEALGDYFSGQLSRKIKVSLFSDQKALHLWLIQHRVVDVAWLDDDFLAALPVGEVLPLAKLQSDDVQGQMVARQGLDSAFLQELRSALLSMQDDAEGHSLLKRLQGERFVSGMQWVRGAAKPLAAAEVSSTAGLLQASSASATPVAEVVVKTERADAPIMPAPEALRPPASPPSRKSAVARQPSPGRTTTKQPEETPLRPVLRAPAAGQAVALGLVVGNQTLVRSAKQAEALGNYFSTKLSRNVKVGLFDDQAALHKWLSQHRVVDFTWFNDDYLAGLPVGEVLPLAKLQGADLRGQMVARQGLDAGLLQDLQRALLEMREDKAGEELLSQLRGEGFLPGAPWARGAAKPPASLARGVTSKGTADPVEALAAQEPGGEESQVQGASAAPALLPDGAPPVPAGTVGGGAEPQPPAVAKLAIAEGGVAPGRNLEPVPPAPAKGLPEAETLADVEQPPAARVVPQDTVPEAAVPLVEGEKLSAPVASVAPEVKNLARLMGKSEIMVLADADGQFVKSMAENQVFAEEAAQQVDETYLEESIHVGRSYNRESLAALARTEQAQAQTGQALSQLLPYVAFRANRGYEISKPSVLVDEATGDLIGYDKHLRSDVALTIRQPLFDLPGFLDWQRRKVKEEAREESYRVSDGDAYLATVNSYLALVSSRLQADVTRDFEDQLAELLSYIEKRSEAGAASISDMTRVRARRQSTLSSRLELESAHAAAGSEFVRLTNLVPQRVRLPEAEEVGASLLPKTFDEAVVVAMQANPEIASLNAELDAAEIDQRAISGRYLPSVDAEYTDTYALHAGGAASADDQRDRRLMVVLNWELFSGGNTYHSRQERLARTKELQYRLDDQRRRVVQALSAHYAALATTRERIASGYQELSAISMAAEAMSKRMLSGNQSLLDLLDVYNQLYQVRFRLVGLHTLEMNTTAQIARLTQGAPRLGEEVSAVRQ